MPQQNESLTESAARAGRFGKSVTDTQKKGGNMVTNLQNFAKAENERKRREEEEKKKKAAQVNTAPQKGFIQRMIDKYYYGKKEE